MVYSAKKDNFESFVEKWMDHETIILNELSPSQKVYVLHGFSNITDSEYEVKRKTKEPCSILKNRKLDSVEVGGESGKRGRMGRRGLTRLIMTKSGI